MIYVVSKHGMAEAHNGDALKRFMVEVCITVVKEQSACYDVALSLLRTLSSELDISTFEILLKESQTLTSRFQEAFI
jgi:hypothetical protein